jgi:hypothetical protein
MCGKKKHATQIQATPLDKSFELRLLKWICSKHLRYSMFFHVLSQFFMMFLSGTTAASVCLFLRTKAGTNRARNEAPGGNRKAASGFTAAAWIPAQQRFQWKLIGT